MSEPRVVVAGPALVGRHLTVTRTSGARVVTHERRTPAGAGALGAIAAAATTGMTGAHVDLAARVGEDETGTWLLAELIGRGVDVARLSRWGATGECLVLEGAQGEETVLAPGEVDADAVPAAVAAARAGDVLLVDAFTLVAAPEVVQAAYDADLQIVADLCPVVPGVLDHERLAHLDVVVVDAAGAGELADAGVGPSSLAVHGGAVGAWWDDLRHVPTAGLGRGHPLEAPHRFAGALSAGLAAGMDRPEAFTLAVAAAAEGIEA